MSIKVNSMFQQQTGAINVSFQRKCTPICSSNNNAQLSILWTRKNRCITKRINSNSTLKIEQKCRLTFACDSWVLKFHWGSGRCWVKCTDRRSSRAAHKWLQNNNNILIKMWWKWCEIQLLNFEWAKWLNRILGF